MLVEVQALGRYEILGESLDDAAGEAFDKTAKLLGLPYPGGAHLSRLAEHGRPGAFKLPRPMLDRPGLDFSFSGLKTAAQTALRQPTNPSNPSLAFRAGSSHATNAQRNGLGEVGPPDQQRADIALAFEQAIVGTLVAKTARALEQTGLRTLVVAGGVGANRRLREELHALGRERGVQVFFPRIEFCTDNAAMIAVAGLWRLKAGQREDLGVRARARWPLNDIALNPR